MFDSGSALVSRTTIGLHFKELRVFIVRSPNGYLHTVRNLLKPFHAEIRSKTQKGK